MKFSRRYLLLIISTFVALVSLGFPFTAKAVDFPKIPNGDIFVIDQANMISETDESLINSISLDLRNQKSIPIIVVSIESLADYDAEILSIEAYARALFDHWGIGREKYNYGMLLLVSKNDRKARIELGAAWMGTANKDATYIMDEIIIRRFRMDKYSSGIREGAIAMDTMARGKQLPSPYYPKWLSFLIYGGGFLTICGLIAIGWSLMKSGKNGRGWVVLSLAFGVLLFLLRLFLSSLEDGFAGGGSSGGGGATGSW